MLNLNGIEFLIKNVTFNIRIDLFLSGCKLKSSVKFRGTDQNQLLQARKQKTGLGWGSIIHVATKFEIFHRIETGKR